MPIHPDADSSRRAWTPCPNCDHGSDCPECRNNHSCQTHWQYLLKNEGTRVSLQCPTCSYLWTVDAIVETISLGGPAGEVATSPDGNFVYLAHSGTIEGTRSSWISVVTADGATVAVVPVHRHATGLGVSPDGSRLYVATRQSSSYLDWRGSISVIDTETYRVVDSIAVEVAPDTVTVSRDGTRLYATHYHKNSISIIDLETHAVTRRVLRDGPIDLALAPTAPLHT